MTVVLVVGIVKKGRYCGILAGSGRLKGSVSRVTIDVGINLGMLEYYYRIVGICYLTTSKTGIEMK